MKCGESLQSLAAKIEFGFKLRISINSVGNTFYWLKFYGKLSVVDMILKRIFLCLKKKSHRSIHLRSHKMLSQINLSSRNSGKITFEQSLNTQIDTSMLMDYLVEMCLRGYVWSGWFIPHDDVAKSKMKQFQQIDLDGSWYRLTFSFRKMNLSAWTTKYSISIWRYTFDIYIIYVWINVRL